MVANTIELLDCPNVSTYDAFISYNHSQDRAVAKQLQRSLESFAKPFFHRRSMRVFRDETNLEATPDLWATIAEALGESGFFVLLASPESAQSNWVDREVKTYLRNHDRKRICVALTSGKLPWTDPDVQLGVPECAVSTGVYEQFQVDQQEPLVIDLRQYRSAAGGLNVRTAGYDNAIATLAASILRRDKDTLFGEHITRQRRIRTYVVVSAGLFLALGLFGVTQLQTANEEKKLKRENLARSLASYSRDPQQCQPPVNINDSALPILLATAALQVTHHADDPPVPVARQVLLQTLAKRTLGNNVGLPCIMPKLAERNLEMSQMVFSIDNQSLYGYARQRKGIGRWDLSPDKNPARCDRNTGEVIDSLSGTYRSIVFSPNRRWLAVAKENGDQVFIWSIDDQMQTRTLPLERPFKPLGLGGDARWLITGDLPAESVQLWDLQADPPSRTPIDPPGEKTVVTALAFSHDGQRLATSTRVSGEQKNIHGGMYLWEIDKSIEGPPARRLIGDYVDSPPTAFSADGRWLAAGANLWDLAATDGAHELLPVNQQRVGVVIFSDDNRWLFLGGETVANISARLWNLQTIETEKQSVVLLDERNMGGARYNLGVLSATFSHDSRWLATTVREKQRILLWPLAASDMIETGRGVAGRELSEEEAACYKLSDLLE